MNGEFYPCKPDIFEKTYEPVEQSDDVKVCDASEDAQGTESLDKKNNLREAQKEAVDFKTLKWNIGQIQMERLSISKSGTAIEANPATHRIAEYVMSLLKKEPVREAREGLYTQHFIDWRDKYFIRDIKILEYKSKSKKDDRRSLDELHKFYSRAMLESPFKNQSIGEQK